jgi:integrase
MPRYNSITPYNAMQNLFDKCPNPYWKRIAKGLYYTGSRAGELIQITSDDIQPEKENPNFINITIHTEKNPHAPIRYIPISLLKESDGVDQFVGASELVFPPYNPSINPNSFLRVMRKKFNDYWGVAPHYFRHCRLTHMVTEFDFNDQELVKYAGWTDSKPAKWYMSLKTTDLQKKMGMSK